MFLTDAQIISDLGNTLRKGNIPLTSDWQALAPEEHLRAYGWLFSTLLGRGWSQVLIGQWDYGAQYERSLSLYFCLVRGGALDTYDPKFIELLDVRKEVCGLPSLSVGGVWQAPDTTVGQPTTGALDTGTDLFGPAWDSQDPRVGKTIRW